MTDTKPDNYYEGLNQKLLNVIPAGARNIIEFGCANGRLGEAYIKCQPIHPLDRGRYRQRRLKSG